MACEPTHNLLILRPVWLLQIWLLLASATSMGGERRGLFKASHEPARRALPLMSKWHHHNNGA